MKTIMKPYFTFLAFIFFISTSNVGWSLPMECLSVSAERCEVSVKDLIVGQFCSDLPPEKLRFFEAYNCPNTKNLSREEFAIASAKQACISDMEKYEQLKLEKNFSKRQQAKGNFQIEKSEYLCGDFENFMNQYNNFGFPQDYFYTQPYPYKVLVPKSSKYIEEKISTTINYSAFIDANYQFSVGIRNIYEKCQKKKKYYFQQKEVYFSFCENVFSQFNSFPIEVEELGNGNFRTTLQTTLYTIVSPHFEKKFKKPTKDIYSLAQRQKDLQKRKSKQQKHKDGFLKRFLKKEKK